MGQAKRKEKAKAKAKRQERLRERAAGDAAEQPSEGAPAPVAEAAAPQLTAVSSEKGGEAAPSAPAPTVTPWVKPEGLSQRGWAVLVAVILATQFPLIHYALLRDEPDVTTRVPYQQDFSDPGVVERDFFSVGGYWRVVGGQLLGPQVKNNPLWLQARLPDDVAVEFDVRSEVPEGDIRVELFGDGTDPGSGYVLIHGGWNNTMSVLARRDVNAPSLRSLQQEAARAAEKLGLPSADLVNTGAFKRDTRVRVESTTFPVQVGRTYRWRVERRGTLLRWSIDGRPFLELNDPFPLKGYGHDRLGLSGFDSSIYFDNLRVLPVDASGPSPTTSIARPWATSGSSRTPPR